MLIKILASLASPGGPDACLSTLIFHRVLAQPDPLFPGEPDAKMFDKILDWVGENFNVISLADAVAALARHALPARALVITFDDGYADNEAIALPVLKKHSMNATFFVASNFIDGGRMWNDTVIEAVRNFEGTRLDLSDIGLGAFSTQNVNDRRSAIDALLGQLKYRPPIERSCLVEAVASIACVRLPDDLMMTSGQICALRDTGMIIGGHTSSHPILARLSDAEAFDEIVGGKRMLETILGETVDFFAYPNGKPGRDYLKPHKAMVEKAGFTAAVTTAVGVARGGADLFQIPRFTPWDRSKWRFGVRMLSNMRSEVVLAPAAVNATESA
jgi:peptidoglycan/xylan/chitin deacetylase (PgdA/CDA1 family)